ncbi:iron-siderophore ABC transporter substrate-binding protein [Ectobacillus antri]|uniref:Iron-siderophore ABC transporter substrate-binding protein n=1 Tax=Ectobacillus antri TaxID=2486280 RepID=A0ABT6H529_9BACI|nr:iron-siderophore ABC transporter substrate-binding protein [Ectobacillus antri]MDG4657399.1 iron-siderophore ABC transporter substrate-binding protein [Ectobacillus antri]MDG5754470.1 iron-siderophore ABC transporter substrate-binding protein [Ectobacillus antri]
MKKTSWAMLILLLSLSLVVSACGKKEEPKQEAKKSVSYTVQHAMGSTEIKGDPKRVVVLTNEGTEAILAMGIKPVGAVQSWTGKPWYKHIEKDMKDAKVVGTESEVNLEAIAALKPDLIIGNKMRQEKVYEQLNAIAPTVFSETLRGDWKENFNFYAKALNKEAEGKKVMDTYESRIKELQGKLGDKLNQKVSIVRFMGGDVRIYHKDSFSGVILEEIGFKRPESQDKPDFAEKGVTKERVPAMDGDILFYFTYDEGDGKGKQVQDEWIKDPLFQNLQVVKNKQVFEVSDTIWNTAGGVKAANLFLDDIEKYFLKK